MFSWNAGIFAVMDYLKLYRRFIYSHYFSEGLRMSIGVLLPALVAGYHGYFQKGIFISLGALCVSLADNPGPIHHRRNGLLVSCAVTFVMAIVIGFSLSFEWLFLIILPLSCFLFSMIGVYGVRATSIGIGALLVMVMLTHQALPAQHVWLFSLLLLAGSLWYTMLSLLLNRLQPYKLVQQVLGEYVLAAAEYLRTRSVFYGKQMKETTTYQQLMYSQVELQHKQDLAAELLFKTRGFVKESSNTGRILMMVYLDTSDLLERAMTAHFDYNKLHEYFDDTSILEEYRTLILGLARELDTIGIALISKTRSTFNLALQQQIIKEKESLAELRKARLSPKNLEGFISLRHILDSLSDMAARINTLHRYTYYDPAIKLSSPEMTADAALLTRQDYSWQLLVDNLSWQSNIFRHSIRVTIAAMVAYVGGIFWSFGHNYWILMTVIFILKPGFGLTRMRNKQRIIGTLIGATVAGIILYFVKNSSAILVLLTIFMIGGYSFMRWKYLVSISFMTVYLLLMFHLIEPQYFTSIVKDRIIDTFIGCGIAFIASLVIPSVWEKVQMSTLLKDMIQKASAYYSSVAFVFTGRPFNKQENDQQRKAAWVSLANLSDSFNRMLSEPRSQQQHSPEWHRVVVSCHMIVSHTATLSSYAVVLDREYISNDYVPIISGTIKKLERISEGLANMKSINPIKNDGIAVLPDQLSGKLQSLIITRQQELEKGLLETKHKSYLSTFKTITDQFYFIQNASGDIEKLTSKLASQG